MDGIDGNRGISLVSAEEIDQWFDTERYSKFEVWMLYQCLSSITVWWFGPFFIFPDIGNHHPN